MKTMTVELEDGGVAYVDYNSDLSGTVVVSWTGKEDGKLDNRMAAAIPAEVVQHIVDTKLLDFLTWLIDGGEITKKPRPGGAHSNRGLIERYLKAGDD